VTVTVTDIALDYDSIVGYLEEVIEEKGADYVYTADPDTVAHRKDMLVSANQCLYSGKGGKPGCIIGHLIHKLNPGFDLTGAEFRGAVSAMEKAGLRIPFQSRESLLVTFVQQNQDRGESWGKALENAKTLVAQEFIGE
jgi:hypothetical protein